jgi:hypothetical protein
VGTFASQPQVWNDATITNNIIVNNMAGWDGAGISLQDALNVKIINNTIMHNTTLATSGVLTNSLGAPSASAPPGNCTMPGPSGPDTASCPQSAGVTSTPNSSLMAQATSGLTLTCPPGQTGCQAFSNPLLANDLIWQNTSFYVGVGSLGTGNKNQQNVVSLYDAFTNAPAPTQGATGACAPNLGNYWEVGVRGDRTINGHESGFRLSPQYSALTDDTDYPGANNLGSDPAVVAQYCNGSRVPPECTAADGCAGPHGFGVPPGIADAVAPNPVFSLTPSATVDEGNNWINVSWGPLSLTNPSLAGTDGNYGGGAALGNYVPSSGSPAIDYVPVAQTHPSTDFFGNPRPDPAVPARFDIGAVEFQNAVTVPLLVVTPSQLAFGNWAVGTTSSFQTLTLRNDGGAAANNINLAFTGPFSRHAPQGGLGGTCTTTLPTGQSCTINVIFTPTTATTSNGSLTITTPSAPVDGSPVPLTGTGVATRATLSITPNPLPITLPHLTNTGTGTVTLTNTAAAGGAQVAVTAVTVAGSGSGYSFSKSAGADNCTGATLAPGQTCTVGVTFANPSAPRGVNRAGTITFTDNGAGNTQVGNLVGHANP